MSAAALARAVTHRSNGERSGTVVLSLQIRRSSRLTSLLLLLVATVPLRQLHAHRLLLVRPHRHHPHLGDPHKPTHLRALLPPQRRSLSSSLHGYYGSPRRRRARAADEDLGYCGWLRHSFHRRRHHRDRVTMKAVPNNDESSNREANNCEEKAGTRTIDNESGYHDDHRTRPSTNRGTTTSPPASSKRLAAANAPPASNEPDETPPIPPSPPLFHHWTVCVVPPPSNESKPVWEAVTSARTALRDPGLYRWPPHANLLYPFVDCYERQEEDDTITNATVSDPNNPTTSSPTRRVVVRRDVLKKLREACRHVPPFVMQLRELGTFGGSQRGVLWLDPQCADIENCDDDDDAVHVYDGGRAPNGEAWKSDTDASAASPLVRLQTLLEQQFPYCSAQRMAGSGGVYRPHMTLSHFVNLDAALAAQSELEATMWNHLSPSQTDFVVDRIYVLTRQGDDGQFERVAEIMLGSSSPGGDGDGTTGGDVEEVEEEVSVLEGSSIATSSTTTIIVHEPCTLPFPDMPIVEEDWVREQRMALKKRRNRRGNYRRRRRSNSQASPSEVETSPRQGHDGLN